MNYGLYLSASGVLTNMYRQDVFANNLANAQTVGFKNDLASILQRDPESIEDPAGMDLANDLLDRLGGGVLAGPQRVNFEQGGLRQTDNPLDMAILGRHAFFAVQAADANGNPALRFTRDGRFTRDSQGFLVTSAGGYRVLDSEDRPIRLAVDAAVQVDHAGRIIQNGEAVATVQVTGVTDPDKLVKEGQGLFRYEGQSEPRRTADAFSVRSGFVEESNVDPIRALMKLVEATKAVTSNGNLIRYHDLLMDRAVNTLGRVA